MPTIPTTEELLKHAKKERDLVLAWLGSLDEFIRNLERFLGVRRGAEQVSIEEVTPPGLGESQRFRDKSSVTAAKLVLRDFGRPMHLKDIVTAILKGGYERQTDPHKLYSTLFTNLKRRPETFKKVDGKRGVFGLVEWATKK